MKFEHLEYRWHQLMRRQNAPVQYIIPLWREITVAYNQPSRHYHNLHHLVDLFNQADEFKHEIVDFDTLELAIWYHDIINQCLRKDNEEKSAVFAKYRLEAIQYPREKLVRCYHQINATKKHILTNNDNNDTAWLIDFDLSILGKDWEIYQNYTQLLRKEYAIFPDFLYNRGRKKVIQLLLERERLFQTAFYYEKYESQARLNLQKELKIIA